MTMMMIIIIILKRLESEIESIHDITDDEEGEKDGHIMKMSTEMRMGTRKIE